MEKALNSAMIEERLSELASKKKKSFHAKMKSLMKLMLKKKSLKMQILIREMNY